MKKHLLAAAMGLALGALTIQRIAGPVIIDGSNAEEHEGVSAGCQNINSQAIPLN